VVVHGKQCWPSNRKLVRCSSGGRARATYWYIIAAKRSEKPRHPGIDVVFSETEEFAIRGVSCARLRSAAYTRSWIGLSHGYGLQAEPERTNRCLALS
jgi:hypothetical protein